MLQDNINYFNYILPKKAIAQKINFNKAKDKILVYFKKQNVVVDTTFYKIINYINDKNYILIMNNSKVLNARLICFKKNTFGKVELLFLEKLNDFVAKCLYKTSKNLKIGQILLFKNNSDVRLEIIQVDGKVALVKSNLKFDILLRDFGKPPLPPYIKRDYTSKIEYINDYKTYQPCYGIKLGSVAAHTAGLHFDQYLLSKIKNKVFITIHINWGSFEPILTDDLNNFKMKAEYFYIPSYVLHMIKTKKIIAVGTSVMRALQTYFLTSKTEGYTDIFIKPGFKIKNIFGLLTNFHQPKSGPFLLTSAYVGLDKLKQLYYFALRRKYRFLSYGDCMLMLESM